MPGSKNYLAAQSTLTRRLVRADGGGKGEHYLDVQEAEARRYQLLRPFHSDTSLLNHKRRAEEIAEQLQQRANSHCRPWYMLDPEGLTRRAWDLIAYLFIWVLLVLVPLTIAFYEQTSSCDYLTFRVSSDPDIPGNGARPMPALAAGLLSTINWFFVADVILNVLTGFVEQQEEEEAATEYRLKKVGLRYARTWLAPDVLACFPLNCILVGAFPNKDFYNLGIALWLLRALGLRRRFDGVLEWINRQLDVRREISYNMRRILHFSAALALVNHYFACLLWLVLRVQGFPEGTYPVQLNLLDAPASEQWLFSFFGLISAMIGLGYGSYPPVTWPEVLMWVFAMVTVAGMFAVLNGFILSYILAISSRRQRYEELEDAALRVLGDRKVALDLEEQVVAFLRAKRDMGGSVLDDGLMKVLPPAIKTQVALLSTGAYLARVPLFKRNPSLLEEVAPLLRRTVAVPGQVLEQQGHAQRSVLFIVRGLVDVFCEGDLLDTLGPGDYVGEAALLPVPMDRIAQDGRARACVAGVNFKAQATIVALTRCQLYSLHSEDFRRVAQDFPEITEDLQERAARYLDGCMDLDERQKQPHQAMGGPATHVSAGSQGGGFNLGDIRPVVALYAPESGIEWINKGVSPRNSERGGSGFAQGRDSGESGNDEYDSEV